MTIIALKYTYIIIIIRWDPSQVDFYERCARRRARWTDEEAPSVWLKMRDERGDDTNVHSNGQ